MLDNGYIGTTWWVDVTRDKGLVILHVLISYNKVFKNTFILLIYVHLTSFGK